MCSRTLSSASACSTAVPVRRPSSPDCAGKASTRRRWIRRTRWQATGLPRWQRLGLRDGNAITARLRRQLHVALVRLARGPGEDAVACIGGVRARSRRTSGALCRSARCRACRSRRRDSTSLCCSHLLFTWADQLGYDWHLASLRELVRVADEVRVFPTVMQGPDNLVPFWDELMTELRADGVKHETRRVDYEFQVGAQEMLVLTSPS